MDVYKVSEVAEELRCSQSAVYRLVNEGRLRCYRVGKTGVRVTREALDEFKAGVS